MRKFIPSTLAAIASLMIFAGAAYAWPDNCDEGYEFEDEETGGTCTATGTISVHAGIEFCNADCEEGRKLFTIVPE